MSDAGAVRWGVLILVWGTAGCDCYSSEDPDTERDGGARADGAVEAGAADAGPADAAVETDAAVVGDPPLRLDVTGAASSPRVGMDGSAHGTVVWSEDGTHAKRWEAGAWGETEVLGSGEDPRLDFNAAGAGVVTWRVAPGGEIAARLWVPGEGWLRQDDLGRGAYRDVAVAIDGQGNAVALFDDSIEDRPVVVTARYEPATGWSDAERVESPAVNGRMPDIATNEAGDFSGIWANLGPPAEGDEPSASSIWVSRWLDDDWQEPMQVGDHVDAYYPRVSVDGAGNSLAVWKTQGEGRSLSLWAAWQPPGLSYGDLEELDSASEHWTFDIAAATDGSAFVAWTSASDALVVRYDPPNGWEQAVTLDVLDAPISILPGRVAVDVDESGGALVVWAQEAGGRSRIWAARYLLSEGWTDPVAIDDAVDWGGHGVDVALAPDGTALVAWQAVEGTPGGARQVWGRILEP